MPRKKKDDYEDRRENRDVYGRYMYRRWDGNGFSGEAYEVLDTDHNRTVCVVMPEPYGGSYSAAALRAEQIVQALHAQDITHDLLRGDVENTPRPGDLVEVDLGSAVNHEFVRVERDYFVTKYNYGEDGMEEFGIITTGFNWEPEWTDRGGNLHVGYWSLAPGHTSFGLDRIHSRRCKKCGRE